MTARVSSTKLLGAGAILASTLSLGCASVAKSKKGPDPGERLERLGRQLQERNREVEILRGENLILKQRLGQEAVSLKANPARQQIASLPAFASESEHYAHIVQTYRDKNVAQLAASVELFLQKYPLSPQADNALFWLGSLQVAHALWPAALQTFDQMMKSYPNGNKRVSAMFAKAIVYKKLNLPETARDLLREVITVFPGSPESYRARLELRLLEQGPTQNGPNTNS